MTVSTQVSRNEYVGNGVTTQYDFTFRILDKSHLLVQTLDAAENITTLTLGSNYSVTGVNRYPGGKVVLTTALPAGHKISIERKTPVTQETSIRNQGGFFPEIHEDAFDKLTMLVQQVYGWWSGLALKKPSWLANYYDAMNNRIRNLRDPSQAQDAATKGYADNLYQGAISHSDNNFKRTLRVPESEVGMLPGISGRRKKILAFNDTGNPIAVLPESGSAADVLISLASNEPGMGASLSVLEQGGTVQDALVCVYVDGFGADPSGETDSTDAVLRAVKTIATLLTSCYDNTNSKYAVVVFGNGTYVIGDVPFFSGIRYVGQGQYATRIEPKPGAQYCFTTVGTKNIDQAASSADRMFNSGVCNMSIGCGYQTANTPNYTEPPENVGGIFVKSASYMRFEHLDIRFIDGCGIDAVELFDSDIRHVKMMSVGNARDTSSIESIVPALRLMPDGDYSSTNAVRIHALHIEECAKHMHIGKRTRHVFFTGGCKFEGAPDTHSSTITGVHNVTFSSPELTWQRSDIPMFEMAAGFEGINSSYGIVFENPSCISAPDTKGYYFHAASGIAVIQINNLFARDAHLIAEGSQIQVNGGAAFRCGPYLFNLRGDSVVDGFSSDNTTVNAGLHAVNLSGTGNAVRNSRFVSAGSETDETCVIAIGSTATDAVVAGNAFGGTRGYAMILGNAAAEKLVYDNRQLAGAVFSTFIKNSQPRLSFTQAKGKAGLTDGTISISPGADGWVAIIGLGTVISLHCTGSDGSTRTAALLTSYEINVVNLISQTGTMFKTDTTGAVIGNGFVYLTTALNSQQLRIINYSTQTLTIKLSGLTAALAF